jgi:hypothetical protein
LTRERATPATVIAFASCLDPVTQWRLEQKWMRRRRTERGYQSNIALTGIAA